ncbi:hypothetical protein FSP39_003396, partial [Pinctada imbricata]
FFFFVSVGFSEVYGYGFRFYEYLPPLQNITTSVDEQESRHGMYAMRTFLYPRFYMALFYLAKVLSPRANHYLIGRLAHCFISSLLPVAVYRLTSTLFSCRTVSLMSAICTAFSVHLFVLGTHTLVNSFLSSFVIFALTPVLKEITKHRLQPLVLKDDQMKMTSNGHISSNGTTHPHMNGHTNSNLADGYANNEPKVTLKTSFDFISLMICGFVLGVCFYIRIDSGFFMFVIIFTFVMLFCRQDNFYCIIGTLSTLLMGGVCGVTLGGWDDYLNYGKFFLSPMQWFYFNIRTNMSSVMYGSNSKSWYLEELLYPDIVSAIFSAISVAGLIAIITMSSKSRADSSDRAMTFAILSSCIVLLFAYSIVDHKELRFVHNVDILICILIASALHKILSEGSKLMNTSQLKGLLCFTMVTFILNSFSTFPSPHTNADSHWIYKHAHESADVNQCLNFIRHRNDVTGVVIDNSLYLTGGYTILGHDVPLIVLVHNEYHEYDPEFNIKSTFAKKQPQRLRIINRISDYIYGGNVYYLTRTLFKHEFYNYVLTNIKRIKSFSDLEYKVIFRSGTFAVLYRNPEMENLKKMNQKFSSMKVGKNATILEYEGSWLYTTGLYEKAAERLERALELDSSRWRPYQILGMSYVKLENWRKAKEVEQRCFKRHGEHVCRSPQGRIVLEEGYNNFNSI